MKINYTPEDRQYLHKMLDRIIDDGDNYCVLERAMTDGPTIKVMRLKIDMENKWI